MTGRPLPAAPDQPTSTPTALVFTTHSPSGAVGGGAERVWLQMRVLREEVPWLLAAASSTQKAVLAGRFCAP